MDAQALGDFLAPVNAALNATSTVFLLAVPLGIIGVVTALLVTRSPVSVLALIGSVISFPSELAGTSGHA